MGEDTIKWGSGLHSHYVAADLYRAMRAEQGGEASVWNKVWKWRGPRRMQVFMWLAMHERLLTSVRRSRIVGGNSSCYRCIDQAETTMHVLRDCSVARDLWLKLRHEGPDSEFFLLQGRCWFTWNLSSSENGWALIFGVTCWLLWGWRNRSLFEEGFSLPENLVFTVLKYVANIHAARVEFGRVTGPKQERYISWLAPPVGWVKINVDGASKGAKQTAGCGGLIRGSCGEWLGGFSRKLGCCSAIKAELWAVLSGLELACSLEFQNIIVECDSLSVVSMLADMQMAEDTGSSMVLVICRFLRKFAKFRIIHVYREGNMCADALANFSYCLEEVRVNFSTPPDAVRSFLFQDEAGVAYPRSVVMQD